MGLSQVTQLTQLTLCTIGLERSRTLTCQPLVIIMIMYTPQFHCIIRQHVGKVVQSYKASWYTPIYTNLARRDLGRAFKGSWIFLIHEE